MDSWAITGPSDSTFNSWYYSLRTQIDGLWRFEKDLAKLGGLPPTSPAKLRQVNQPVVIMFRAQHKWTDAAHLSFYFPLPTRELCCNLNVNARHRPSLYVLGTAPGLVSLQLVLLSYFKLCRTVSRRMHTIFRHIYAPSVYYKLKVHTLLDCLMASWPLVGDFRWGVGFKRGTKK